MFGTLDEVITIIKTERIGPAKARNAGAASARGVFLFFIDDDCLPPPDWIEKYFLMIQQSDADIMGSRLINMYADNMPAVIYHKILDEFFHRKGGREFLLTANMICKREVFRALKGFDERLFHGGEDRDFVLRANKAGYKVIYTDENSHQHFHEFTHIGLWKHTYMQGRGSFFLYRILSRELQLQIKPIPFAVYSKMALSFLNTPGGLKGLAAFLSFVIMQVSSLSSIMSEYFRLWREKK